MELYKGTDANRTHERFSAVATSGSGAHSHSISMSEVGNNTPHNNMQPYTSCYIWRRTEQHAVGELAAHSHSGSTSSAGSHSHTFKISSPQFSGSGHVHNNPEGSSSTWPTNSAGSHTHTVTVGNTGGNAAHNNLAPYLSVNIWKRVS